MLKCFAAVHLCNSSLIDRFCITIDSNLPFCSSICYLVIIFDGIFNAGRYLKAAFAADVAIFGVILAIQGDEIDSSSRARCDLSSFSGPFRIYR